MRGQAERCVQAERRGRAGRGREGTWLRSSGETFRLLTEAAFWSTCLASSTLPLVRSQRADSGRALQARHGCDLSAPLSPPAPRGPPSCWGTQRPPALRCGTSPGACEVRSCHTTTRPAARPWEVPPHQT